MIYNNKIIKLDKWYIMKQLLLYIEKIYNLKYQVKI